MGENHAKMTAMRRAVTMELIEGPGTVLNRGEVPGSVQGHALGDTHSSQSRSCCHLPQGGEWWVGGLGGRGGRGAAVGGAASGTLQLQPRMTLAPG